MNVRYAVVVLLTTGFLGAQAPKSEKPDISVGYNFVVAPVTARDGNGNIVNGLSPADFQLYDNGKLQKITEDSASHPLSMVVAVQASANMDDMLRGIRKTGILFSDLVLGASGEIAVISFDHRIQTMTEFTSDPDKISSAFQGIKAGSATHHLNDAAMQGVNMLRTRDRTRRRVLMIIGETRDVGSKMDVREVLTAAQFRDITVYAVEVSHLLTSLTYHPDPLPPNPIPPEARDLSAGVIGTDTTDAQGAECCTPSMGNDAPIFTELFFAGKDVFVPSPQDTYTKFTGGRKYAYKRQRGLEKAITEIGEDINSQYLLTYLPNDPDPAGYHNIDVKVLKPGLSVTTRPGYWSVAKP